MCVCVCAMLLVHYYVVCTRYTILTINKWKAAALIDLHLIKCWRGALTLRHFFSLSLPVILSLARKERKKYRNMANECEQSKWVNRRMNTSAMHIQWTVKRIEANDERKVKQPKTTNTHSYNIWIPLIQPCIACWRSIFSTFQTLNMVSWLNFTVDRVLSISLKIGNIFRTNLIIKNAIFLTSKHDRY